MKQYHIDEEPYYARITAESPIEALKRYLQHNPKRVRVTDGIWVGARFFTRKEVKKIEQELTHIP